MIVVLIMLFYLECLCGFVLLALLCFTDIVQVILLSETIQEMTKTSQALSLVQNELSELRKVSDAQKAEYVCPDTELGVKLSNENSTA